MSDSHYGSAKIKARAQDVFQRVARHLFDQGERSTGYLTSSTESCQYRGSEGRRCAIGVLIPDDMYAIHLEGRSIQEGIVKRAIPSFYPVRDDDFIDLLEWLQQIHDQKESWIDSASMWSALYDAGKHCDLDTDFLETLTFSWDSPE